MSNLTNALIITGIGMGLVFIAILLLWGLMELMGRYIKDKPEPLEQEEAPSMPQAAIQPEPQLVQASVAKAKAASVAVAVAMALSTAKKIGSQRPDTSVTGWQAALRANRLNQRSGMFFRK